MNEIEIGWLTGLVEGEGTISITKEKPKGYNYSHFYYPYLQVSNTNEELLRKIKEVTKVGTVVFGNLRGVRRPLYWKVKGKEAVKLIENIFPLLIVKREKAKIVFEFEKLPKRLGAEKGHKGRKRLPNSLNKRREELFQKMKARILSNG